MNRTRLDYEYGTPLMSEEKEAVSGKLARDVLISAVVIFVIEPTLKALHFEGVVPYLPYIWLFVAMFLTLDVMLRSPKLREWAPRFYGSLKTRNKIMSYAIVAMIGATTFSLYWWGITAIFKARGGTTIENPGKAETEKTSGNNNFYDPSPAPQPAGYITFSGQIIDGYAPMMQVNQTKEPLDNVKLHIIKSIPTDESHGTVVWQKEINIGTCPALLTKGMDERFPVSGEEKIHFDIFMETRFRTYREEIDLLKVGKDKYDAHLKFNNGEYEQQMTLTMVTLR